MNPVAKSLADLAGLMPLPLGDNRYLLVKDGGPRMSVLLSRSECLSEPLDRVRSHFFGSPVGSGVRVVFVRPDAVLSKRLDVWPPDGWIGLDGDHWLVRFGPMTVGSKRYDDERTPIKQVMRTMPDWLDDKHWD